MAIVLVIDASASVRETLRIVLGSEHDVVVGSSLDHAPAKVTPDVVVLGLPAAPRDDRAIGEALARLAPDAPLLLLHAASGVEVEGLVPPQVAVEFLPKPFDAYGVRARVRALVAARRVTATSPEILQEHRRFLEFPFLPHAAAAIVRRVMATDAPLVLLQGEAGTGAAAIARALHIVGGRRGAFVALDAARLAEGDMERRLGLVAERGAATLHLANVDRARDEVQSDLLQAIEHRRFLRSPSTRLIAGVSADLGELAAAGGFLPELAYAVTTLPVTLTPLRDRPEDIGALAEMLTRELCARFGFDDVTLSPAALERLQQYLWFGNVAELEAVLARTLALHQPRVVDADDLVFLAEHAGRALAPRTGATTRQVASGDALAGLDLEVVLGELAHELRNPMVTIKTFVQHLDSVLADPEVRARFSELTTDAIGRMDGLLETLLDFSRFRAPTPHPIDVQAMLDRVLGEHDEELARRHVTVERNGLGVGPVAADEAQVLFALRSLCRGLVPDLVTHTSIKIRGAEPGVLELLVRTDASIAERLAAWVEPRSKAGRAENPPLAWALASALLQRNGGALTVSKGDAGTMVVRVDWTGRAS